MGLTRIVIAVPARLESSRLPNKVLAEISGQTMITRVLKQCLKSRLVDDIFLCTDNEFIENKALEENVKVVRTRKNCKSGSERIASVLDQLIIEELPLKDTLIINVQGDQPFLDPNTITKLSEIFINAQDRPEVITPIYPMSKKNIHNPNVVKTLIDMNGQVLYFSRSAIPHVRGLEENKWGDNYCYWGHVGIYGFRGDVLSKWQSLPESKLENVEKLEQLRLIDAGIKIQTFKVKEESLSVDTIEQLEFARKIAKNFK